MLDAMQSLQRRVEAAWRARGVLAWSLWPLSAGLPCRRGPAPRAVRGRRAGPSGVACTGRRRRQPGRRRRGQDAGGARRRRPAAPQRLARRHRVARLWPQRGDGVLDLVTTDMPPRRCGDEPLLLRLRSGAPVVVGRDRPAAARALLRLHPRGRHCRQRRRPAAPASGARCATDRVRRARRRQRLAAAGRAAARADDAGRAARAQRRALQRGRAEHALAGRLAASAAWPAQRRWPTGGRRARPMQTLLALLRGRPLLAAAGMARPGSASSRCCARTGFRSSTPLALPDHHPFRALPWPAQTST